MILLIISASRVLPETNKYVLIKVIKPALFI